MTSIPPPLNPDDFEIEVIDAEDCCTAPDGRGDCCATFRERSAVFAAVADVATACSPEWLRMAVPMALRGVMPRTRCYVVPTRTGGVALELGPDERVVRPQAFGGLACHPAPWGRQCDEANPHVLPEHEALAPAARPRWEDAGDVVFEDWDGLRAPLFGGKAGTA